MTLTFILTSAPLLLGQVSLASFVPDVSQPYADITQPYTVPPSEYSVRPETAFTGVVSTSSGSLLDILATKFVSLLGQREKDNTVRLEAEEGRIYTLDNPDDIFNAILTSEEHGEHVKRWLERWKRRGQAPRFVVGYRTFVNATLMRANHVSHTVGGGIRAPIGAAYGDPSGMADVAVRAAHTAARDVQSQATLPGERIYAIAYRKIRVTTRKGILTAATANVKTKWEPFSGERAEGEEDEPVHFEADMSAVDDDEEDIKILFVNSQQREGGDHVRIGLLDEDNSSEDEDMDTDGDG